MKYLGLIITGTSGSGKTTLVKQLTSIDSDFACVPIVTTRKKRPDDNKKFYHYVSHREFNKCVNNNDFYLVTNYRNYLYGIKKIDLSNTIINKIPILTVTPEHAAHTTPLVSIPASPNTSKRFYSVFLDNSDSILNERLIARDKVTNFDQIMRQRIIDRSRKHESDLILVNDDLNLTVSFIKSVWKYLELESHHFSTNTFK